MSRKQVWKVIGLSLLFCGLEFSSAQGVTFTFFDAPGAVLGSYIQPQAINPAGVITGYYTNPGNMPFGFVRALDGTITYFGQPGTQPQAINPAGTIVGYYLDANFIYHGFLRTSGVTLTTIDAFPNQNAGFTFCFSHQPHRNNRGVLC